MPRLYPSRPAGLILSLLALTICASGCGDSTARVRLSKPAPLPFRWLIALSGPQPSIAAENRLAGTRAWRLDGGSTADVGGLRSRDVEGYVSSETLLPGERERIYVSAPGARTVRIEVFRIGWYGGAGGREILRSRPLRVVHQPRCAHDFATGLTECDWHPTLSFTAPPALPTGVYIAKLIAAGGMSDCLFVVRARGAAPLLAQLPTATYEAYNAWGGDSLYPGGADTVRETGTDQGVAVSLDRPYDSVTGAGQFFARDVAMVRFLERYGYRVAYTTTESADSDPGQLGGHRALLDFGHSEYWSQRDFDGFRRARDAGTNLVFLSSDTVAWRIRYGRASRHSSENGQPGHVIIAYKEHFASEPGAASTGAFPGGGAQLTGTAYVGCITARLDQPGPPTYRYFSWSPLTLTPSWLFAGTGITLATTVPGIVGYELDQLTPASPRGVQTIGEGRAACSTDAGEPQSRLAPDRDVGQTTLYTAPSGATVFSSGTLGWELGLSPVPSASPDAPAAPDPRLVALTRNLLARMLQRPGR